MNTHDLPGGTAGFSGGSPVPIRVRRGPLLIPTRPLQFPSLSHLDERVAEIAEHTRAVDGLRPLTITWALRSYRSLRRFLVESREDAAFLSGDVNRQLRALDQWIGWLRLRGVSRVAINNYWRGASSIFRWISSDDGSVNPFTLVQAPKVGRMNPRCLTKSDAERLLIFVRNFSWKNRLVQTRNLAIIGVMLLAGLRRGEVVRLQYADVNMEEGTIRITAGKGRYGGKDRTCYMPPQLRTILAAYIAERRRAGRTHAAFLTCAGEDRGVTEQPVRRVCDLAARSLGLRLTPHVLRHTYATLLRQAGVPDRVSMELLGHTSLAMLQRYSHVFSGEHLREASKLHLEA
jgi:integrase/recombinase XerD